MDNQEHCPTTTAGGNSTITNGDEQQTLNRIPEIPSRVEGPQDAEFH